MWAILLQYMYLRPLLTCLDEKWLFVAYLKKKPKQNYTHKWRQIYVLLHADFISMTFLESVVVQ